MKIVSDAGIGWAVEYKRVLDHYDRYGRFAWETFGGGPWREFEPEPPAGNCAECGAAISEAELGYSRQNFGRALCRRDQSAHPSTSVNSSSISLTVAPSLNIKTSMMDSPSTLTDPNCR